ncbi:MAG TPA: ATP-dependent helicase HrpB [Vicinamibacterales bacterium]|nr:ATP-dependent helicase HrpB [Vicinamibacterales bacterium]
MAAALPIDAYIPAIVDRVRSRRALIISAAPGAGKTTRVPPALAADGPVLVLQPRRVAARAMARRIADEQGWTLGREVGWHVRLERRFTAETRVLFATEGILTARLQQDPLLSEFRTIVLDEFHERSLHADLGLALARQAWRARGDLRLVIMSATLQADSLAAFLDDCPRIEVPGRIHPLTIDYRPGQSVAAAAGEIARETVGSILCFLPGAPEITRAAGDVRTILGAGADVVLLHGSLPADEQDRAISEGTRRRIILATNIAETSLTVPGVTGVIDSGYQKVARFDPDRGIDSLATERIPADSAEQRAGRAGRLGPGRVRRLWDRADRLRVRGEPEIHRVDLSDAVLDVLAWGGDPRAFEWFDAPAPDRIDAALALLEQLGAVRGGLVTRDGHLMKRLPLHPRLARMLIDGGGGRDVALACAFLSERHASARLSANTVSDLLSAVDEEGALPPHVRDVARRLADAASGALDGRIERTGGARERDEGHHGAREQRFLRAVFAGYPDRVARRRAPGSPKFLLASGHGAVLGRESGVRDAEFLVALDVQAARQGEIAEATIRMASAIDPSWLEPTSTRVEHAIESGRVRAVERRYYGEIPLGERPSAIDPEAASRLLAEAYRARGLSEADTQLVRRLRFAGLPSGSADVDALVAAASVGKRTLDDIELAGTIEWSVARELERRAPTALVVPSGRTARVTYQEDGSVIASVKLQELFGLAESPRLGPRQLPIVFELLAPNGRPVQTTSDLRSFWNTTYQDVRKELRGRYPRHPWPEDPWTALPTARTKKRPPG